MNIGIDAKWFYEGASKIVVKNLIQHFIDQNSKNNVFIFLDRRMKHAPFPYKKQNVHLVYLWAENNLISNLTIVPALAKHYGIDVFIAQLFSPLFSSFKRISFVYDISFESNPSFFTWLERLYFSPIKLLSKRAHKICTISFSEKKRLIKYKYNAAENIQVVYMGVDRNIFKPVHEQNSILVQELKEKYGLPRDFLLYVGRLNIRKNLISLIHAMPMIKNTTIPLVIAGGKYDWKKGEIQDAINALGLKKRIILTGYMEDGLLPVLYSLAKIFCYVSLDEGFGLPPLEAMASGIPIVVSDIDPLREVCSHAGSYADPHNPKEIANRINELLADNLLYQSKRAAGLERAGKFNWNESAEEVMKCVNSIGF